MGAADFKQRCVQDIRERTNIIARLFANVG